MTSLPEPRRRRQVLLLVATPLLALLAFLSWGLSSPVGSSPDDDFHLASIWCGHGPTSACETTDKEGERVVYRDLVADSVCFAFNADASAACHGADFGENPDDVTASTRNNASGLYPPLYYFTMSLFTSPDIESSVLVMKLVNSLLFVGTVTVLFWLLPVHRRPTLLWSFVLSLIPLGMFIVPSTNPSGWAVLAAGTLWISFLGFMETTGRRKIALGAMATLAAVIGAGARADAALFGILAVALVLLLTFERTRAFLRNAALGLLLVAISAAFYLGSRQGSAISTGLVADPDSGVPRVDPIILAMANVINVPGLWTGALGFGPLGWLDTAPPSSVGVAVVASFCGAVFIGMRVRVARKGIALLVILAALWTVPTVLLVQSQSVVGANFQPRYILPLLVLLAGFLLLQGTTARIDASRTQRLVIVIALSLANAVALFTNIRRYVTGLDVSSLNLDLGAEWWWHLPIGPTFTWIAGSLAFAGMLVAINSRLISGPAAVEPALARATVLT